jgi:hypothetical protein
MNREQERAYYVELVGLAQEALHQKQREALARFTMPEGRPQLQQALLDAHRAYQAQIGLR